MSNVVLFKCKVQKVMQDGSLETSDNEREFCVRRPTPAQSREAQKVYNTAFQEALSSNAILRAKLDDVARAQGLWDDKKQEEFKEINSQILHAEKRLNSGGFDLDEAVKLAKEVRKLRAKLRALVSSRTELDVHTVEGQADNARFNYLVSACLVYNDTQKPVFSNMDDYLSNSFTDQAVMGATKLAQMLYQVNEDYESKYAENQFLKEYGFVDEKNRFVNESGHLVDEENRLINEDGHFVLEDGTLCDIEGNKIDEDGNYVVEKKPFLKDGKPVLPKKAEEPKVEEETKEEE